MTIIKVNKTGDACEHIFRQESNSREIRNKPYMVTDFVCSKCGKKRKFATLMNGSWLERNTPKGEDYV